MQGVNDFVASPESPRDLLVNILAGPFLLKTPYHSGAPMGCAIDIAGAVSSIPRWKMLQELEAKLATCI